jgi:hypothetical protein
LPRHQRLGFLHFALSWHVPDASAPRFSFSPSAGWAQEDVVDPEAGIPLTLDGSTDVAALGRFPFCQCQDYRCASSPYRLNSIASPTGRADELCYQVQRVGCSVANPCCGMLLRSFSKVEISTGEHELLLSPRETRNAQHAVQLSDATGQSRSLRCSTDVRPTFLSRSVELQARLCGRLGQWREA